MNATFKTRMLGRERLAGTLLSLPSPEIAEICAEAGFDWLFLDWEHGLLEIAGLQRLVQAAEAKRCPCLIRVPDSRPVWIAKALDTGAAGVIIPHVNGAGDAAAAVRAAKYPPQGARSIGVARAQGYGAGLGRSLEEDNRDTVVIAQAEHFEAARNIDAILDVPGVDAVFIGPFDLSASLNKPGRIADTEVQAAIGRIRAVCTGRGKAVGIFTAEAAKAAELLAEGFTFVCVGTDALLLAGTVRRIVSDLKA